MVSQEKIENPQNDKVVKWRSGTRLPEKLMEPLNGVDTLWIQEWIPELGAIADDRSSYSW